MTKCASYRQDPTLWKYSIHLPVSIICNLHTHLLTLLKLTVKRRKQSSLIAHPEVRTRRKLMEHAHMQTHQRILGENQAQAPCDQENTKSPNQQYVERAQTRRIRANKTILVSSTRRKERGKVRAGGVENLADVTERHNRQWSTTIVVTIHRFSSLPHGLNLLVNKTRDLYCLFPRVYFQKHGI